MSTSRLPLWFSPVIALWGLCALTAPARAERKASSRASTKVAAAPEGPTGGLGLTGKASERSPRRPDAFLTGPEVGAEIRPYAPEIKRCYLDERGEAHPPRRAGHLDVTFVIRRDGRVVSLAVAATGLSGTVAHRIEACIQDATAGIRFPVRRNDTTAIVPYEFLRTDVPGAGPQLSCWSPRGC